MKKKSWFNLFIKRWIPLLVVAGIIAAVVTEGVTWYFFNIESRDNDSTVSARYDIQKEQLEEWKMEEGEEKKFSENRIQFFTRLSADNYAEVLFNENFEIFPNGEEIIIPIRLKPDEELKFYSCPASYFDTLERKEACWYDLEDCYIKDEQFLPGKVVRTGADSGEVIEIIDLTPENVEGYQYVALNTEPNGASGITGINLYGGIIPEDVVDYFKKEYEKEEYNDVIEEGDYWYYECYICSEIILSDNSKFYLISNYNIDLWLLSKAYLIPFYVGIFIFSTMLAAIWALRNYKNDQMLSYQKNLTRALAHDLKSPLMVISGYAQNLSEHICPEKEEYYAKSIVENVEDMSQTITDILELSRLQDQKKGLKRTKQSVDGLVQEMIGHYKDVLCERRQEIVVTGDTTINCDAMLMKRVFDNLISNAIYHSEEGSKITIEISEKKLVISNPVSEEIGNKKEQLLEPFEKGDESRKQPHGTGIGLSIAKSILKMHKYSIKIEYKEKTFVAILVFGKKKF